MANRGRTVSIERLVVPAALLLCAWPALAQFVAFNDYAPGGGTHTNATTYGPGSSGRLKDIVTGAPAAANLLIYSSAITYGPLQSSPAYGTPAYIVFDGY